MNEVTSRSTIHLSFSQSESRTPLAETMEIFKHRSSTFNHSKALLHALEVSTLFHFSVNPFLILKEVVFQIALQYIYKINQLANLIS